MTDEAIPFKKKPDAPDDAQDISSLWLDPGLGDGIVNVSNHNIPVGKPKDFFRVHPDPAYRRRAEVYTHKPEGVVDEEHYILAPAMRGRIPEARPATIVTCIYRDGSVRLWPISFPREGERDNEAWITARSAAKSAMEKWVKLVWLKRAYQTRDAQPGYAPEPDYTKLPSFDALVEIGYKVHGIIRDTAHPIYRELYGAAPEKAADDGDDL
jgi:hypothetical protein